MVYADIVAVMVLIVLFWPLLLSNEKDNKLVRMASSVAEKPRR